MSLLIQRNLAEAGGGVSKTYETLSSGQRINRASDDAAGLSIAMHLNLDSKVYHQGIRNINDGASYLAIADGAMKELGDITGRQLELSEQAANGVYNKEQRRALDIEADALADEFNRIIKSTEFNGQKILDIEQSTGLVRVQAGFGVSGSVAFGLGDELSRLVGTGGFSSGISSYSTDWVLSYDLQIGDIDGDGDPDIVTTGENNDGFDGRVSILFNQGNGSFGGKIQYISEATESCSVTLGDINGDGALDVVTTGMQAGSGWATVRLNDGNGSFGSSTQYTVDSLSGKAVTLSDINEDGKLDLITAGSSLTTIRLNDGQGSFGQAVTYSGGGDGVVVGDINGDGLFDIVAAGSSGAIVRLNGGSGDFSRSTSYATENNGSKAVKLADVDNNGSLDLVTAGTQGTHGAFTIRFNNGDGSFGQATQYSAEKFDSWAVDVADLNGDGNLDIATAGGREAGYGSSSVFLNDGSGRYARSAYFKQDEGTFCTSVSLFDLDGDNVLDLVTAGGTGGRTSIRKALTHEVTTVQKLNLCTQENARNSIVILNGQLNRINSERGAIGAMQSRLETAANALYGSRDNSISASARITDADIAQESAKLIRLQIVQQSASAVLAQANQAPRIALELLRHV